MKDGEESTQGVNPKWGSVLGTIFEEIRNGPKMLGISFISSERAGSIVSLAGALLAGILTIQKNALENAKLHPKSDLDYGSARGGSKSIKLTRYYSLYYIRPSNTTKGE